MATCRECLHFETCLNDKQQTRYYGEKEACNNVQDLCRYFISKSEYVKRERGEWICLDADLGYTEEKCSMCGYIDVIDENDTRSFCPNCGADMRKEDNNA